MHLKLLILILAFSFCFCSIAQTPADADRHAYEACKETENPVEEYDCLSTYLKKFPAGFYHTRAQKRLEELNNVPQKALEKALETAQRSKDCSLLERFEKRYAYNTELTREAALKRREICPPLDPCADIRNFNNLFLSQCLEILKNPLAGAACKAEVQKRILAIEENFARALDCNNVNRYIERFPNGRFRARADSILRFCSDPSEIQWQALNTANVEDLRRFLLTFPESHRKWDVKKYLDLLDDHQWESALKTSTTSGFESYLKTFPQGRHSKEAVAALDKRRKGADSQEDLAFQQALKNNNPDAILAFLASFPDSKYKSTAEREIRRLSPPRYFITKLGNSYITVFQNLENPRILNLQDFSDSLIADLSEIRSNQITFLPLQEGIFSIQITDDWGKKLNLDINTGKEPFKGDMTVQNDTLFVKFFNETPPFSVLFTPIGAGLPIRIEGIRDSLAKFSLDELYVRYGLKGEYQVSIEKSKTIYADLFSVKVAFPMRYWMYIGAAALLLVASVILIRRQLRLRRIRRKMKALR